MGDAAALVKSRILIRFFYIESKTGQFRFRRLSFLRHSFFFPCQLKKEVDGVVGSCGQGLIVGTVVGVPGQKIVPAHLGHFFLSPKNLIFPFRRVQCSLNDILIGAALAHNFDFLVFSAILCGNRSHHFQRLQTLVAVF